MEVDGSGYLSCGGVLLAWVVSYFDFFNVVNIVMYLFLLLWGFVGCVIGHGGTSNYTVNGIWYAGYVLSSQLLPLEMCGDLERY